MISTIYKISVALALVLFTSSCKFDVSGLAGKGPVETKTFQLEEAFTQLDAHRGWNVELIKANENKLVVSANQNLIDAFEYSLEGNALKITSNKNVSSGTRDVKVYYSEPLTHIDGSSGAQISSKETLEQEEIKVSASSGSEVNLSLKTKKVIMDASSGAEIQLSGTSIYAEGSASSGSEIEAKKLKTKDADLKVSSGAEIEIHNEGKLNMNASSGGSIDYYGNPEKVSKNKSVSGGRMEHHSN